MSKPQQESIDGSVAIPSTQHCRIPRIIFGSGESIAAYLAGRHLAVLRELANAGSMLFRGFSAQSVTDFRAAVECLVDDCLESQGEHIRVSGEQHVFNPVKYPPERKLLWHNENSFNRRWPHLIVFGCVRPATMGGETLLVDSRTLLLALDTSVVEEFRCRGVQYVRRMGLGIDRDWQDILGARSKAEAEARCAADGMSFRWLSCTVLETASTRSATAIHPVTRAECWFNQLQHWHPRCLEPEVRRDLIQILGEERMPRDCRFGDGALIPDVTVDHILEKYRELEVLCACEAGDVLVVDNIAMAHGRAAFRGPREIMVMMGTLRPETLEQLSR